MDAKKGPDFVAWNVVDVEGNDKGRWSRCGVGFANKESLTILLDTLPVNGKLVLMKPKEPEAKEQEKLKAW